MKLSEQNRTTLLVHLHKVIEEIADVQANKILQGRSEQLIDYPQNGGLTGEEQQELKKLQGNEIMRDALRKVLASNSASVFFDFFNIVDGTGDPDPETGKWSEIMLIDMPKDFDGHIEFLHDHFYDTYWNWKEKRRASFNLDLD